MKYFSEFINQYGLSIIHSFLAIIISYITVTIKRIYKKHVDEEMKEKVVNMVCHAINQLYPNASSEDKLNKAIINAKEILSEKGISLSDLELRMYIEYTVGCFNSIYNH